MHESKQHYKTLVIFLSSSRDFLSFSFVQTSKGAEITIKNGRSQLEVLIGGSFVCITGMKNASAKKQFRFSLRWRQSKKMNLPFGLWASFLVGTVFLSNALLVCGEEGNHLTKRIVNGVESRIGTFYIKKTTAEAWVFARRGFIQIQPYWHKWRFI